MNEKRRGQGGFTLIELLIVVAILGILAAVIVPNLGRLLSGGEVTARNSEFESVKTGVISMMVDNGLATLPNAATANTSPCTIGTQDMAAYPDSSSDDNSGGAYTDGGKISDPVGGLYDNVAGDLEGFILFGHDATADDASTTLTNYVETATASSCYTVDAQGTVTQYDTAGGSPTNP